MIQPSPSIVAPHVVSPTTGDVVLLVDQVERLLARGKPISVRLVGEGGRDALQHLASVFDACVGDGGLRLEHELDALGVEDAGVRVRVAKLTRCDITLQLSGWSRDEVIDYLLAKHPEKCGSVMNRLKNANFRYASGSPAVWRLVLDQMALDSDVDEVHSIVINEMHRRIGDAGLSTSLADMMLLHSTEAIGMSPFDSVLHASVVQVLSQSDVALTFTNERFVQRLRSVNLADIKSLLSHGWPWGRLKPIGDLIRDSDQIRAHLIRAFGDGQCTAAANCATLLCLCDPSWRPGGEKIYLRGGRFHNAMWADIDLSSARLDNASFCGANLMRAKFKRARMNCADFSRSDLRFADFSSPFHELGRIGKARKEIEADVQNQHDVAEEMGLASLFVVKCRFDDADLSNADLSGRCYQQCSFAGVNLSEVRAHGAVFKQPLFEDANLSRGDFSKSRFLEADLRTTKIDHAIFDSAEFLSLNMDEVTATEVSFRHCGLSYASLTGSSLTACSFYDAILVNAKLADINWPDCDLRHADLRGCNFHMGSTRSGVVGSPYPSHGTRTGFYTDDFDEQYFKSPELIRKASLSGSDLRGAYMTGVDFYLVDLRGAKYDAIQRKQFVATGAILDE